MRGTIAEKFLLFDLELEQWLSQERKARPSIDKKEHISTMAEEQPVRRTLLDYLMPNTNNYQGSIVRPPVQANNFEIKPALLQVIQHNQFGGAVLEDPHSHMENFVAICDTLKINGISDDAIRLRLFSFSLRYKAKSWLRTQPQGSISTWEYMATKFVTKYFSLSK